MMNVAHDTLSFERVFDSTPADLFRAYADPRVRELWSAPSPFTEVRIDEGDFCTGGEELGRCGAKGDLRWSTRTYYHLVVPDALISFTEELREGDQLLTIALVTLEIADADKGVRLKLTDQVTSLVGAEAISGHREGYAKALDNLALALLTKPAAPG